MNRSRYIAFILLLLILGARAAPASAAECVWTGAGANVNWSLASNWTACNNTRPQDGDALLFPGNAARPSSQNDLLNLAVSRIRITGLGAGNTPYTLRGNAITLTGPIAISAPGAAFAGPDIQLSIVLGGNTLIEISNTHLTGGTAIVERIDLNGHGLIFNAGAPLAGISSSLITGNGTVEKLGPGPLLLRDGTYTGPTLVSAGWVSVRSANAFGAGGPGNGTTIKAGAFIAIDASMSFIEAFSLTGAGDGGGAIRVSGASTNVELRDLVLLANTGATIGVHDSGTLTISSPMSMDAGGGAAFAKVGNGTLVLSGATNGFPLLDVAAGTVRLGAANVIPDAAQLAVRAGAAFELADFNETLAGINNAGAIDLGKGTLTVGSGGFSGVITGSGNLVKTSAQILTLAGAAPNTFTGTTTVNGGELRLAKPIGVTALRGAVIVNGGALVSLTGDQIDDAAPLTLNNPGSWKAGVTHEIIGSLSGSGGIAIEAIAQDEFADLQIGANNASTTYSGTISGTGRLSVSKVGAGTLTLTGTHTFTGGTLVSDGTLIVNGSLPNTANVLVAGGRLGGTGSVGILTGPQGRTVGGIAPGASPGRLGAHAASIGGPFIVELNGADAGTGYDRLSTKQSVALAATATLQITRGFGPKKGDVFTIIETGLPITGTFAGLPEGAELAIDGQKFRISYANNSVTLTAIEGPGARVYYLSEGATGPFFDEDLLIANPNDEEAPVTLTFFKESGEQIDVSRTLAAKSHALIRVDELPGLEATVASVKVTSTAGLPLVVERTMFWDERGYGGHTGSAIEEPAPDWFFAEGAQGFFDTFVLIVNPNTEPVDVTITFLRQDEAPVVKTMTVGAGSRRTVNAGEYDELRTRSFGITVHATQPIMAERAMYFASQPGRQWGGGHESAGATTASRTWFLAEGATSRFFDTFILLSNPQDAPAHVTLDFLLSTGEKITVSKTIAARARLTVNPKAEDDTRLDNAALSTVVTSDVPIVAERSMYWPGRTAPWGEAHNSFGVVEAGTRWGLAEGRGRASGRMPFQTYILLANPQATDAAVTVTYLREGAPPVVKTYTVRATSRFNIDIGDIAELRESTFGALIEVTNNVPIIVERSIYWDRDGVFWSGGTNATGIRLP